MSVTTVYGLAKEVDVSRFNAIVKNTITTPTTAKPVFMRLANKIWIYPQIIGGDGTDALTATAYYYKAVATVSESVESEIPTEFQHLVIKRAEADVLEAMGRINDKEAKIAQVKQELTQAMNSYELKQNEANKRIKSTDKAKLQ